MRKAGRLGVVSATVIGLAVGSTALAQAGVGTEDPMEQARRQIMEELETERRNAGARPHMQGTRAMPQMQAVQGTGAPVRGEVLQVQENVAFLLVDEGAVVPVRITGETMLQGGEPQQRGQNILRMLHTGDQVRVTLRTRNGQNVADRVELVGQGMQQKELQGTVATRAGEWVNVDVQGTIIPLRITRRTTIEGEGGRQALREGAQVRATFHVEDAAMNVANRIEVQPPPSNPEQ